MDRIQVLEHLFEELRQVGVSTSVLRKIITKIPYAPKGVWTPGVDSAMLARLLEERFVILENLDAGALTVAQQALDDIDAWEQKRKATIDRKLEEEKMGARVTCDICSDKVPANDVAMRDHLEMHNPNARGMPIEAVRQVFVAPSSASKPSRPLVEQAKKELLTPITPTPAQESLRRIAEEAKAAHGYRQIELHPDGYVLIWTGYDNAEYGEVCIRLDEGCSCVASEWEKLVHDDKDFSEARGDLLEYYGCLIECVADGRERFICKYGPSTPEVIQAIERLAMFQVAMGGLWALQTIRQRKAIR